MTAKLSEPSPRHHRRTLSDPINPFATASTVRALDLKPLRDRILWKVPQVTRQQATSLARLYGYSRTVDGRRPGAQRTLRTL